MTTLFISGTPVAQPRAKATTFGGHVRMYTPSGNGIEDFKTAIRFAWRESGATKIEGPARVDILAVWPRPKSITKKRGPNPPVFKTSKPDIDNVAKAVYDALTGLAFDDDQQVASGQTTKLFAGDGLEVGTTIRARSHLSAFDWIMQAVAIAKTVGNGLWTVAAARWRDVAFTATAVDVIHIANEAAIVADWCEERGLRECEELRRIVDALCRVEAKPC